MLHWQGTTLPTLKQLRSILSQGGSQWRQQLREQGPAQLSARVEMKSWVEAEQSGLALVQLVCQK